MSTLQNNITLYKLLYTLATITTEKQWNAYHQRLYRANDVIHHLNMYNSAV